MSRSAFVVRGSASGVSSNVERPACGVAKPAMQRTEFKDTEQDVHGARLAAYQRALEFIEQTYAVTKELSSSASSALADHLRHAAISVALNLAEGGGRPKREFRTFLRSARSSCYNCVSLFDLAASQQAIPHITRQRYYHECGQLARMISGLCHSLTAEESPLQSLGPDLP